MTTNFTRVILLIMSKAKKRLTNFIKDKKTDILVGGVTGIALSATTTEAGGAGGGGGGGPGNRGSVSYNYAGSTFSFGTNSYSSFSAAARANGYEVNGNTAHNPTTGETMSFNGRDASTPFLMVWNGSHYVHENDFLFGKPNTAFTNEAMGRAAYEAGIGGDTYVLSDTLRFSDDGKLRLQIRELEPEQSFIDRFALFAIDLAPHEHLVTDGNLSDSYVFDTRESKTVSGQTLHHYAARTGMVKVASTAYQQLGEEAVSVETMLQKNDELILKLPVKELTGQQDLFLLVDSYFRDWTLGNSVPLSYYDLFNLYAARAGRLVVSGIAALVAYTGISWGGQSRVGTPVAIADVPHCAPGDRTCNPGTGSRSLVITAEIGGTSYYLQTIFPRFVRYTEEVVRVPRELLAQAADGFLTLRIRATKKHAVRAAFAFYADARSADLRPLAIENAVRPESKTNLAAQLAEKNLDFVHLTPGNVIDLVLADLPRSAGTIRKYVLKANGFYTRLPAKVEATYRKLIYPKLAAADQKLLRTLRMRA